MVDVRAPDVVFRGPTAVRTALEQRGWRLRSLDEVPVETGNIWLSVARAVILLGSSPYDARTRVARARRHRYLPVLKHGDADSLDAALRVLVGRPRPTGAGVEFVAGPLPAAHMAVASALQRPHLEDEPTRLIVVTGAGAQEAISTGWQIASSMTGPLLTVDMSADARRAAGQAQLRTGWSSVMFQWHLPHLRGVTRAMQNQILELQARMHGTTIVISTEIRDWPDHVLVIDAERPPRTDAWIAKHGPDALRLLSGCSLVPEGLGSLALSAVLGRPLEDALSLLSDAVDHGVLRATTAVSTGDLPAGLYGCELDGRRRWKVVDTHPDADPEEAWSRLDAWFWDHLPSWRDPDAWAGEPELLEAWIARLGRGDVAAVMERLRHAVVLPKPNAWLSILDDAHSVYADTVAERLVRTRCALHRVRGFRRADPTGLALEGVELAARDGDRRQLLDALVVLGDTHTFMSDHENATAVRRSRVLPLAYELEAYGVVARTLGQLADRAADERCTDVPLSEFSADRRCFMTLLPLLEVDHELVRSVPAAWWEEIAPDHGTACLRELGAYDLLVQHLQTRAALARTPGIGATIDRELVLLLTTLGDTRGILHVRQRRWEPPAPREEFLAEQQTLTNIALSLTDDEELRALVRQHLDHMTRCMNDQELLTVEPPSEELWARLVTVMTAAERQMLGVEDTDERFELEVRPRLPSMKAIARHEVLSTEHRALCLRGQYDRALTFAQEDLLPAAEATGDLQTVLLAWESVMDGLSQLGRVDQAIDTYRDKVLPFAERCDNVVRPFRPGPLLPGHLYELGRRLRERAAPGDVDEARRLWHRALELLPNHHHLPPYITSSLSELDG